MISIKPPFNPELLDILNSLIKELYNNNISNIKIHDIDQAERFWDTKLIPDQPDDYYTSLEHLEYMKTKEYKGRYKDQNGYSEVTKGINMTIAEVSNKKINEIVLKYNKILNEFFCTKFNAVSMYYPPGGFMGWHNNGNAYGYNVLLSWTNGEHNGFFQYIDPVSKELVQLYDNVNIQDGWTIKAGYFGGHHEEDKLFWHSARTFDNERITLGFVIPTEYKYIWDMMVEDLKDEK